MTRFYRWYDQQPESKRFLIFIAIMFVTLFTPSAAWIVLYWTPYRFDLFWVQPLELILLLPLLVSRMMYMHRRQRRKGV